MARVSVDDAIEADQIFEANGRSCGTTSCVYRRKCPLREKLGYLMCRNVVRDARTYI